MSHATREHWVDNLPIVLLGIRSSFKPDVNACAAELVYGSTIRLPGEFLEQTTPPAPGDINDLLHRLRQFVRSQQPQPPRLSNAPSFLDPYLKTCSHVFLRCDRVRRPLQPPYDGPCQVLSRGDKTFKILLNGREETVSVDRLKAAAIETTQPLVSDQPASSSPSSSPSPAPTPVNAAAATSPQAALSVTANTATKPTTRSGRRVHFPDRFVSYHHF